FKHTMNRECQSNSSPVVFFFNDTATTEIYTTRHTLSLHDALPISISSRHANGRRGIAANVSPVRTKKSPRSEEHTSELQSRLVISYAVFCLKKKKNQPAITLPDQYTTKK